MTVICVISDLRRSDRVAAETVGKRPLLARSRGGLIMLRIGRQLLWHKFRNAPLQQIEAERIYGSHSM